MTTDANELLTFYAPPDRDSKEEVERVSRQLKKEILLPWFDAVPISVVVVNEHRQILFCNTAFSTLCRKSSVDDVVGMRPGEALDCLHSSEVLAGCGCSEHCSVCGAAQAILHSLDGEEDCQECRMFRLLDEDKVPLDLQVFTRPIEFHGKTFTLLFALDIGHELRLRYLNNTFLHGLASTAGGISALTEMLDADEKDPVLFPLLFTSSKRLMRDVLYHRDIAAAEQHQLKAKLLPIRAESFLNQLVHTECAIRNVGSSFVTLEVGVDVFESDKRLLGHVLRNMFVNALEAREEHGGDIHFSCARTQEGWTTFSMTNAGEVDISIRKQVFKRYVSSKSSDRGLGTYVMRLLTENLLAGGVDFVTGDNATTFTVTIP